MKAKVIGQIKMSEPDLLDEATRRLMQALKKKASAQGKPLIRKELLRQGYSERFISKLERA